VIPAGSLASIKRPFRNPRVGGVNPPDRLADPESATAHSDLALRYAAVTSRLDELEAVLRGEIEHQRQRADDAEAQLANLTDHADELVSQPGDDARRLSHATRCGVNGAAEGGAVDDELLQTIWDHIIDMGAVQRSMIATTRDAVIRMMHLTGSAGPTAVTRPSQGSANGNDDGGGDQSHAASQ
jgi:hypothetical protein